MTDTRIHPKNTDNHKAKRIPQASFLVMHL